jgi:hypothetical protein
MNPLVFGVTSGFIFYALMILKSATYAQAAQTPETVKFISLTV